MSDTYIGIDTSCYTTSVACVDDIGIVRDKRTMLSVRMGERGLRQSDGLFQHTKNLAEIIPQTLGYIDRSKIKAVCVSVAPRPVENSYMPVFLAGKTAATVLASALNVPLIESTHQQGHIRAALFENETSFSDGKYLGLHLSGGTSEIFIFDDELDINLLGGTNDLHAGQFVDRVGVAMGFGFPAGKQLETLAKTIIDRKPSIKLPSSVKGLECSFSGVETRVQKLIGDNADKAEIALAVYDCMARTIYKLIDNAACEYGIKKVLIAGGVASSGILRSMLYEKAAKDDMKLYFARSELSSDNSVGIALIARDICLYGKTVSMTKIGGAR